MSPRAHATLGRGHRRRARHGRHAEGGAALRGHPHRHRLGGRRRRAAAGGCASSSTWWRSATSASAWWRWPTQDSALASAFERRFEEGELAGHALGNLILAGLIDATGDLVLGVREAAQLLGAYGDVLPATTEPVVLKAESAGGTVAGQVAVKGTGDIRTVSLVPGDAPPPPLAVERIAEADQIVIGPGSLFTSVLAAVAVRGIAEAVASAKAQVVYVCNLRPEIPETEGYDVAAHVAALARHDVAIDVVLCDSIPGMGVGSTDATVHDVRLTGSNTLVHSPAKLAQALSGLLA